MLRREIAAQVMEHFCNDDSHGYSQVNRLGNGAAETVKLSDGSSVVVTGGDRDCSSLVETCYMAAGILPHRLGMWTGNEEAILLAYGFSEVSVHNVQRGDVLWVKGHTALYLGDGYIGEAHHGDYYGGLDGVTGDQDGTEVRMARYYPSHWTTAYHYDYSDEADELTDGDLATIRSMVQGELSSIGAKVWGYRNTTYEAADAYRILRDIRDDVVDEGTPDTTASKGKLRKLIETLGG